MEKGATDEAPPVVESALDLPWPRHNTAARLVASLRAARAGLATSCVGLGISSGLAGAGQGRATGCASLGTTSRVAAGCVSLGASSGVADNVSQESSAWMAAIAAQTFETTTGQASQVADKDDDQSDLLGGLDSSQNLETTNEERNSDDCTPEATRSQSLEISSKTKRKHRKSNTRSSKRLISGSNQLEGWARYK